ncbi:MAG TPA: AraC family transcriptional regulator [Chitinophagaceae bacterium]|nr:AraC family transcriptional regulator [Chitinophagaceae bacterium]
MQESETSKEHKKRIEKVIDHILKNINSDIPLQELAQVANYSPSHLQKIFKQVTGESPKQYTLKVRLETALLLMIIHPFKPIKELSIDCGFSSPSIFSRAVKHYFGISPEEIRKYPPKERMLLHKSRKSKTIAPTGSSVENVGYKLDIKIKKIGTIKGIYLTAPCDDMVKIQGAFKEVIRLAISNDLLFDYKGIYGILSPHQGNIYKTFVAVNKHQELPGKFNVTEIKAGKYATFRIRGDIRENVMAVHFLYNHWLPENGYKIADVLSFELFCGNPAITPYAELEREFYIPVEPL